MKQCWNGKLRNKYVIFRCSILINLFSKYPHATLLSKCIKCSWDFEIKYNFNCVN
jgi:hypothetical protein